MDVSSLCRCCMKEVASWERENFDPRVVEMFSFCTNVRISGEDKLPQQFCYDCVIKIESSYTFITEAQKIHVTLKNIISRSNTSIIVEPEKCIKKHPEIKLTLPDYKICSVIEDSKKIEPIQNPPEVNLETATDFADNFERNIENFNVIDMNMDVENKPEIRDKNVCPVCSKSFTSKTWFAKHMLKDHTKIYTCQHCPKTFCRPSQLTSHAVSHSEERKFACSSCGKSFKRRKQLSVHIRAHDDARPHVCGKCPARFKTKSILKGHMSVHDKDKAFLCYFCGWSFAQAGNLKVHIRTHTDEKPFACDACGFRARAASALRRHQRTHARQRPCACAHCGNTFHDTSNLARHIRTHTGALPYLCPKCPAAFSDSWKRKAHLMRTHRMKLTDIPRMRTDGRVVL